MVPISKLSLRYITTKCCERKIKEIGFSYYFVLFSNYLLANIIYIKYFYFTINRKINKRIYVMRISCKFSIYSLKQIRKNLCIWIIILKMHYELFCHQIIFMGSTSIKCIQFLMKDRLESLKISSILYFFSSSYEPHTFRCLYFLFFDTFLVCS